MKYRSMYAVVLALAAIAGEAIGQTPSLPRASQTWNTANKQKVIDAIMLVDAKAEAAKPVQTQILFAPATAIRRAELEPWAIAEGATPYYCVGYKWIADVNPWQDPAMPPQGFAGIIMIDDEGPEWSAVCHPPSSTEYRAVGTPDWEVAVKTMVAKVNRVRSFWPAAKIGYYNIPMQSYYVRDELWRQRTLALKPLIDACDAIFPSAYDFYRDGLGPTIAADDQRYAMECTAMGLELSARSKGQPVYCCVWQRWHEGGNDQPLFMIGDDEFVDHLAATTRARYRGRGPNGVVLWENEKYTLWTSDRLTAGQWYDAKGDAAYTAQTPAGWTREAFGAQMQKHYIRLAAKAVFGSVYHGDLKPLPVATPPQSPPLPPPTTAPTPPTTQPVPPPTAQRTPLAPVRLANGARTISNATIVGSATVNDGMAIQADNATKVTTLSLTNVGTVSPNYALYAGAGIDAAILTKCDLATTDGGNNYVVRGIIKSWSSTDCTFTNPGGGKAVFRVMGLVGGTSTRDTFAADRMMLGGGYSNEWDTGDGLGEFRNFTFTGCRINCTSIELYDKTSDITFDRVEFTGTHHISMQAGVRNVRFINCTAVPEIRRYGVTPDAGRNYAQGPDPSRGITVN